MSFKEDVPNYKNLQSTKYYMNEAPDGIWEKLEAYAIRAASEESLVSMINAINDIVLKPPTTNWGRSFLNGDLSNSIFEVKKQTDTGKFHILMDTILTIVSLGALNIADINELLKEYKIGYFLTKPENYSSSYNWKVRDDSIEILTDKIEATKEIVKPISLQAYEQLEEAKKLTSNSTEREIKNALWNCVCAMESVIKEYGKDNDIKDATKKLKGVKN